jgi:hypothetical protein
MGRRFAASGWQINCWRIAITLAILFGLTLLVHSDSRPLSALVDGTDYVTFFVTGNIVREGRFQALYVPMSASSWTDENMMSEFAKLPELHPSEHPVMYQLRYLYPPLVALLLTPLSWLTYRQSLIAWQILSLFSVLVSCYLVANATNDPGGKRLFQTLTLFAASFVLLPLDSCLTIGQTSLVFGLLPWAAAYYWWMKERPVKTGLSWACLGLKPQLLVPACLIVACNFLRPGTNKWEVTKLGDFFRLAVPMAVGAGLLVVIPGLLLQNLPAWLHTVKLWQSFFFGSMETYPHYWLLASLPVTLAVTAPSAMRESMRVPSSLIALAGIVCCFVVLSKIWRAPAHEVDKKDVMVVTALSYLPLMSSYMGTHDLTLYLLAGWIIFRMPPCDLSAKFRQAAVFTICAINVYWLSLSFLGPQGPLAIAAAMWFLQICLLISCIIISRAALRPGLQKG